MLPQNDLVLGGLVFIINDICCVNIILPENDLVLGSLVFFIKPNFSLYMSHHQITGRFVTFVYVSYCY